MGARARCVMKCGAMKCGAMKCATMKCGRGGRESGHAAPSWPEAIARGLPARYVRRREGEEARRLQSGGTEAVEGAEAVQAEAEAEAEPEAEMG